MDEFGIFEEEKLKTHKKFDQNPQNAYKFNF